MDYFVGIDVSKRTLDLAVLSDGGKLVCEGCIENEAKPIRSWLSSLAKEHGIKAQQLVVCMEHTGIYSAKVLGVLWKKAVRVCVERALHIKLSQGMVRGKSDKIDAQRIASFAYKNQDTLIFWRPQREVLERMQNLLTLRTRLVAAKTRLTVPLTDLVGFMRPALVKELKEKTARSVHAVEKDIVAVEEELNRITADDPAIKQRMDQITSIKGIGPITAMNVILTTGEFTKISNPKKFACYAGVAPFEHRSGTSVRGRTRVSSMANKSMKRLLHLAAISAVRYNKELKTYYERKVEEGKHKMSVLNAVRNKLISRIFACVNNNKKYEEEYHHILA